MLHVQYVAADDSKYTLKADLLNIVECVKCVGTFDELEKTEVLTEGKKKKPNQDKVFPEHYFGEHQEFFTQ